MTDDIEVRLHDRLFVPPQRFRLYSELLLHTLSVADTLNREGMASSKRRSAGIHHVLRRSG
jgi:hypothetical protein